MPVLVGGPTHDRPAVLVISGSVGAGHDGVAHELADRLTIRGAVVHQRDYLEALPAWAGRLLRDGYVHSVNRAPWTFEWLFAALEGHGVVRSTAGRLCALAERTVADWINGYDAVASTYPLASHTLGQLRVQGCAALPLITVLTDPAVHRFWVHDAVDRHLTVTAATARQGWDRYRIQMTPTGPLVPARFAQQCPTRRAATRAQLDIDPRRALALITTGSLGLGDVAPAAAAIARSGVATPLVLCGSNEELRRRLTTIPGVLATGWRDDMAELMGAADVLVHNAGGLSLTEALVAGLPAVTFNCLPGHGRANAALLEHAGIAPWARTVNELPPLLLQQIHADRVRLPEATEETDAASIIMGLARDHARLTSGADRRPDVAARDRRRPGPPHPLSRWPEESYPVARTDALVSNG